jgi:hypothetical protein
MDMGEWLYLSAVILAWVLAIRLIIIEILNDDEDDW